MKIALYMSLEFWPRSGKSNSENFVEKFMKYWWTYRS